MPITSKSFSVPRYTTPLMTELRPGTSPPPVRMPMRPAINSYSRGRNRVEFHFAAYNSAASRSISRHSPACHFFRFCSRSCSSSRTSRRFAVRISICLRMRCRQPARGANTGALGDRVALERIERGELKSRDRTGGNQFPFGLSTRQVQHGLLCIDGAQLGMELLQLAFLDALLRPPPVHYPSEREAEFLHPACSANA